MRTKTLRLTTTALLAALALAALPLSGCTSAFSGVSGSTLTRNHNPVVSVAATAPFTLRYQGTEQVTLESDTLLLSPTGRMDYALYSPESEGPVTRHAHAFFVHPNERRQWYFPPESYAAPGGLAISKADINGYRWTTQVIRVQSESDWFSGIWKANGRSVPETWLARRFSASPHSWFRIVAEYREPWPECLDSNANDLLSADRSCIQPFLDRSEKVFALDMHQNAAGNAPAASQPEHRPETQPNMTRLAGEVRQYDPAFFGRWQ